MFAISIQVDVFVTQIVVGFKTKEQAEKWLLDNGWSDSKTGQGNYIKKMKAEGHRRKIWHDARIAPAISA